MDVIKDGTREAHKDFQNGLKKTKCDGAEKGCGRKDLKQLEKCLRIHFDHYLVPLLEAIGLSFSPDQPGLFVGLETGSDYRIIVFAQKKADGFPQHPCWAVCLETKMVALDSLEKLAGLALAKLLGGRGERGLGQLECAETQREIIKELLDKKEKMEDSEIQMEQKINENIAEEYKIHKEVEGETKERSSSGRRIGGKRSTAQEVKMTAGKKMRSVRGSSLVEKKEEVGKEGKVDAGKEFISVM